LLFIDVKAYPTILVYIPVLRVAWLFHAVHCIIGLHSILTTLTLTPLQHEDCNDAKLGFVNCWQRTSSQFYCL